MTFAAVSASPSASVAPSSRPGASISSATFASVSTFLPAATGASFTGETAMVAVAVSQSEASQTAKSNESSPLQSASGT